VCSLVHGAGGVAVVAHPASDASVATFAAMKSAGLDGIEVLHPSHTDDETSRLWNATQQLDMLPSGGSDWHGVDAGQRVLGSMRVPYAWYERQLERAESLRAALGG
jgi:predicted metal-dependent phosphoesterase TrpH